MPSASDHKAYLAQPFTPDVPLDGYTDEEIAQLKKYGSWLKALMLRRIEPTSDEQRQFVQMCYGEAHPGNELSRLWKRHQLELMYQVALRMEARITEHNYPYHWTVERFRKLAEQGHQGALAWLEQEGMSFVAPDTPPLIDVARIYPRGRGKLDLMDTLLRLPGSFESGSRR